MYLFAGKRRQSDVASFLQQAHDEGRIKLTLKEYDLELSPDHDLTNQSIWEDIWKTLEEGDWLLLVSPPCNTFSRARFHFQDWPGPRPVRNFVWPRGFPWLSQHHRAVVEEANMFVDNCIKACKICHDAGGRFILEHPEDLGLVKGERPGSIWQWAEIQDLVPACNASSFAIQQCHFGALTAKPTRFIGTFDVVDNRCYFGFPKFDKLGAYKGPLPKSCGHVHTHKLLGKTQNKWNTSPSASYPPGLCKFLSDLVLSAYGRGAQNQGRKKVSGAATVSTSVSTAGATTAVSNAASDSTAVTAADKLKVSTPAVSASSTSVSNATAVTSADKLKVSTPTVAASSSVMRGPSDVSDVGGDVVDLTVEDEEGEQFDVGACRNFGRPIRVEWDGKSHEFIDGFGLCSPTRWAPLSRGHGRNQVMRKLAEETFSCLRQGVTEAIQDVRREAFKLVTGKLQSSPFSEVVLERVRERIAGLLRDPASAVVRDEGQPFFLRMLSQWLEVFEDPDVDCLVNSADSYATGVNVGVDDPLPRSPQVFPPKRKHRKLDETDFNPIAENYSSAQVSSKELEEKFREEELLGRMVPSKLSVLKDKYGDRLRVASMAAILKPDGGVRPLHDATHSVKVNHAIRYRDQLQCPGPAEVAGIVREAVETKEAVFCVSADIKAAHRLVKVRERDWPYLCCRADSSSDTVWMNKTGTFGVSSAPYWWAKLFAAIGRFVGHIMQVAIFWHLVYVDDLHGAFAGGHKFDCLWIWLLAFEVIGTPFGYHKFKGGFSSDFVGFHLRYDKNQVGITTKRGTWLADWIRSLESKRFIVAARDFSEFLGRLGFVAQLLVWLKPHLAPLFAWGAVASPGLVGRLPDTVILTLKYILAEMDSEEFMVSAQRPVYFSSEQFRTDAKCTDDFIVIAGWELKSRKWFSLKLDRDQVPYLFKPNGGGSQWASTSAELLASLAALKAFGWLDVGVARRTVTLALRAGTDNLANEHLSSKRSTTKWPLMLLNLQLSSCLAKARLSLDLKWRPREENTEADQLTNEIFDGFSGDNRIDLKFHDIELTLVKALWETKERLSVESISFSGDKHSSEEVVLCGERVKLWKPTGAVSDTTLEELEPQGTFLAMVKELKGLTQVKAGRVMKEKEALDFCKKHGIKVITCRWVTASKPEAWQSDERKGSFGLLQEAWHQGDYLSVGYCE
eukprot:s5608_g2.t1